MKRKTGLRFKWGATLFALVFAVGFSAGGVFGGIIPLARQIGSWVATRHYVQVPARVVSTELQTSRSGKGGPTYLAKAVFAYEYGGSSYQGRRVSQGKGSDNVGDYQEELHAYLDNARNSGELVPLWVDPAQPGVSIHDRGFRWQMAVFHLPFATLFTMVGLAAWAAIFAIWFVPPALSAQAQLAAGRTVLVRPNRTVFNGLLLLGVFCNLLSWPIAILAVAEAIKSGALLVYLVLLFPAIGVGLFYAAWRTWRKNYPVGHPALEVGSLAPLRARIRFLPALGLRSPGTELLNAVQVEVQLVQERRAGDRTVYDTVWTKTALESSLARGTEVVDFSIPVQLPKSGQQLRVVLRTLGTETVFDLPGEQQS